MIVVAKIGTSSVTTPDGGVDAQAVGKLCSEAAALVSEGHRVVLVTSGAVTAGVAALRPASGRPSDPLTLQALSAIGQHRLMRVYDDALAESGLLAGQVLLAPLDFVDRRQYLHARETIGRMLDLGVVPVVNENDAVADDEIRFGDNDRLAALVAHLIRADLLVLLTDTPGVLSGDPHSDGAATLIEQVREVDAYLLAVAGGARSEVSSGGMASKIAAAHMAAWSGVRAVIASATRKGVLADAVSGVPGVGTTFPSRERRLPARKLWIAFAVRPAGTLVVDDGAREALVRRGTSLLPAGVVRLTGSFDAEDAVEISGADGNVFAKGIVRLPSARASEWVGMRTTHLPHDLPPEVIHRDDLVIVE
ncbi:MAG TPA: glutamate 5-kinase [Acidimicrobiales bacterium]|nr:glutamate 5-kinase [Acidimicrobiales bacterium]